jgi:hypothetical protein
MYVLIKEYVDVHINFLKPIYDLEEYVHTIWRIWYWICMYIIHRIWKILHVDGDEQRRTNVSGQTSMDEKGQANGTERTKLDGWNQMDGC